VFLNHEEFAATPELFEIATAPRESSDRTVRESPTTSGCY
jgi:hypothetical protein